VTIHWPDLQFRGYHPLPPGGGPNHGHPDPVDHAPCEYGCGDYPEWIAYEAAVMKREARGDVVRRFTECLDLPPDLYRVVDGHVVKANGEPLEPIRDQIDRLQMSHRQDEFRHDRSRLRQLLTLYERLGDE
jgi:hypothetical protein